MIATPIKLWTGLVSVKSRLSIGAIGAADDSNVRHRQMAGVTAVNANQAA
jgi:hypothetical protein